MKRTPALLTGMFFLSMTTHVHAQSGSPPVEASGHPASAPERPAPGSNAPPRPFWNIRSVSEPMLRSYCTGLEMDKRRIYYLSVRNYKMSMQVKGIYTHEGMIFFRISICNHSHLDYDADSIRFYIADKHLLKTAPKQVSRLCPLYIYGNNRSIPGKTLEQSIIILPRFTLPEGRRLIIEVLERNGGRHLQLQADNYSLIRARPL